MDKRISDEMLERIRRTLEGPTDTMDQANLVMCVADLLDARTRIAELEAEKAVHDDDLKVPRAPVYPHADHAPKDAESLREFQRGGP